MRISIPPEERFAIVNPSLSSAISLLLASAVQLALRLAEPLASPLRAGQLGRQLVAARLPVDLVLGGVDGLRLSHDLARDLLIVDVDVAAGVGQHLGAVDRDHPDARETS